MKLLRLIFVGIGLLLPIASFAFGVSLPFGGRITAVHTPQNVECGGDMLSSPFTIIPVNGGYRTVGPWSALPGMINVGMIVPQAWILGLVTTPQSSDCLQYNGGEANPYPTTATDFYGTSIPKGF